MIIGLIGEKLAGKDTAAEYLVRKYGAVHIRASHILDELLTTIGLPITRRNEIDIGAAMENTFGDDVIGREVLRRMRLAKGAMIVNNGLRRPFQFNGAKAMGAVIIYITAPPEVRYKRSIQRTGEAKDLGFTFEQFVKQDTEWIEADIPRLGKLADFTINNTESINDLEHQLDTIIGDIRKTA